jgi:nitrite reductase/ring-hydroxylating ferredoxin subunit
MTPESQQGKCRWIQPRPPAVSAGSKICHMARPSYGEESVILLRHGEHVSAWLNICPHAGRRLDWAPGKFLISRGMLVCAAHGASFNIDSGECMGGPCRGESLRAVPVRVEQGDVLLDI